MITLPRWRKQTITCKRSGKNCCPNKKLKKELKKYGKKVQIEVQQNRLKEKRQLMENVKKFRKGKTDNLDFLENNSGKKEKSEHRINAKRKSKDEKFGFGGKKRGLKKNTKESNDAVGDFRRPGFNKKTGGKTKNIRPGKDRRKQMKNKNKKRS